MSLTVTVWVAEVEFPLMSVAVHVTVVAPNGNPPVGASLVTDGATDRRTVHDRANTRRGFKPCKKVLHRRYSHPIHKSTPNRLNLSAHIGSTPISYQNVRYLIEQKALAQNLANSDWLIESANRNVSNRLQLYRIVTKFGLTLI